MRVSDLQNKDVVVQNTGKNIGRIIDIDVLESGTINFFVIEERKFFKSFSFGNNEVCIKLEQIVKIGEDVILVEMN